MKLYLVEIYKPAGTFSIAVSPIASTHICNSMEEAEKYAEDYFKERLFWFQESTEPSVRTAQFQRFTALVATRVRIVEADYE